MSEIAEVAAQQKRELAPLADDLPLQDSGLDSLCWAIVVARLEARTGRDPFSDAGDVELPLTLGDMIRLYEDAAA